MRFTTIFIVAVLLTVSAWCSPAADHSAFYCGYHAALCIDDPVLKVERFLQLLEKYPEKAVELDLVISTLSKDKKVTPVMTRSAENLLKQHGSAPGVAVIALKFIPDGKQRDAYRKNFIEKCDFPALTLREWQAVQKITEQYAAFHIRNNSCSQAGNTVARIVTAIPEELDAKLKFELLYHAFYLFWNGAWEEHCSAPNFDRWQKLPDTGCKKHYDDTLKKLIALEDVLPFPHSVVLLQVYNAHLLKHAAVYAGKLADSRSEAVRAQVYEAAFTTRDRKLLDLFPKQKNSGFGAFALAMYFNDSSRLDKFFPANEAGLIRAVCDKKYDIAEKNVSTVLSSGTVSSPWTIRAMLELIWHTRNRSMLKEIASVAEKNKKKLLIPANANGIAYNFAVLNIELDRAEKLLKYAVNAEPKNPAYLDSMAYLLYRKKRFTQARRFIRLALKFSNPADCPSTILLHAAEIELAATKDKDAAREYLRKAELAALSEDSEYDHARAKELKQELSK